MTGLVRIVMHWTGGAYGVIGIEQHAYHELVDGEGRRVLGRYRPEANIDISNGQYAAHTRGLNTGSVGLCIDAMANAIERPFSKGKAPIKPHQLDVFADMVAEYAEAYSIPITRETCLTHAEVQPTLGVRQRGKWDITWLPGMDAPGDPIEVGDKLRDMIRAKMGATLPVDAPDAGLAFAHQALAEIGATSWSARKTLEKSHPELKG